MAFLLVELGPEAVQFLRILGLLVAFAGETLAFSLFVVESIRL